MANINKYYTRTRDDNRAKLLSDLQHNGIFYGTDGIAAIDEIYVAFGRQRFEV